MLFPRIFQCAFCNIFPVLQILHAFVDDLIDGDVIVPDGVDSFLDGRVPDDLFFPDLEELILSVLFVDFFKVFI